MLKAWTLVALTAATIVAMVGAAPQSPAGQSSTALPWPAGVREVPPTSSALSAAESMRHFSLAPGYRIELVASEPLIEDPILIDFDPDGRLWAIEMAGYMTTITAADEHQPLCRVVVLQDTDDDGRMDSRTVFADRLVLPRALKVLDHGVLVGEPPNLWLMRDTDGDLKADTRESITDQYGTREANVEHNANSLTWALDNWMHTSETDVMVRLAHGRFEVKKTLSRGQWGNSQDDAGRIYRNTNESVLHVDLVPTPYYARNPSLLRTRGSYESLEGRDNEVNRIFPIRPTPAVNRGYQAGVLKADGTLARYTSVASPLVFRGDRLSDDLVGNVFVVEPAGNLVSRIIVTDDGTTLQATKAYDDAEFLASTDERFRPVYLSNAPDGTLYIVDMYRGIIQHRGFITEYLHDQIVERKLEQPIGYGRIYRIVHEGTPRDSRPSLSHASPAELVALLSHPNGWRRDTAQRLLVERGDVSVAPALKQLAAEAPEARTRLHALWTLEGLDQLEPALVLAALADRSRDVRVSGLRLAERFLAQDEAVRNAVMARMDDTDWAVRRQLAATLGELPSPFRAASLAAMLERHADDPVIMDAALSGVGTDATAVMARLAAAGQDTPQRSTALTMLAATMARGGAGEGLTAVFGRIADASGPAWQRAALMSGLESAWLGATLPGSAPRRAAPAAAALPCPTCPGGRGGPGGARAFPTGGAAPAAGSRGGAAPVTLSAEPPLVALAAGTDPLAERASRVLQRLTWPGKPGAVVAAPMSAEAQQRFDRGHEIYRSLCEPCHQADGRGRERMAPPLVGSAFALAADPGVPARVLLNGKEGAVGLMPPLGTTLSDEQIADVLTYVRRAWGQTGAPVAPGEIAPVRASTSGRSRPWTDPELSALASGGR